MFYFLTISKINVFVFIATRDFMNNRYVEMTREELERDE